MAANLSDKRASSDVAAKNDDRTAGEIAQSSALSKLEKEWKLRVHDRLLKIMDLSLIATI